MLKGVIINIDGIITGTEAYVQDFISSLICAGLQFRIIPLEPASVSLSDTLLQFIKEMRLSPEECLFITDTRVGTQLAETAGIPCIGYLSPYSESQDLSRAFALFESLAAVDVAYLRRTHAHAMSYPAEILTTNRLLIREFSKNDFASLYPIYSCPETASFMDEPLADYETERAKHLAYISNIYPLFELALWGIFKKDTGTLIGRAGFSLPENENGLFSLGYLIDVNYRRQGYAKECIPALLSYARDLGYLKVSAKVKTENLASQKVLTHCGFPYHYMIDTESNCFLYTIHLTM